MTREGGGVVRKEYDREEKRGRERGVGSEKKRCRKKAEVP